MSPSPSTSSKATGTTRARAADATTADTARVARLCALAILVPGLGHALIGQARKAAIFFVVLTPVGAVQRLMGRDTMRRKLDAQARSYWIPRVPPGPPPDSLRNQF